MFLVITFNHPYGSKNIVYIPNDDPKTIKDTIENSIDEYPFIFFKNDEIFDLDYIEDLFSNNEKCLDETGEFNWDIFNKKLDNDEINLCGVERIGSVEIIDENYLKLDENGDIR